MEKEQELLQSTLMMMASKIAADENSSGVFTEEQLVERAGNLYADASKEAPETDEGKTLRSEALAQIKNGVGIKTPYIDQPKFDYNALYDSTAIKAVKKVFEQIALFAEPLPFRASKETKEQEEDREATYQKLSRAVFDVLNENNVATKDYSLMFANMRDMIGNLESVLKTELKGHEDAILDLIIGVKNPADENELAARFATHKDIVAASERVKGTIQ